MACVYVYVIVLTFLGPEMKGRSMSASNDEDFAEAAGTDGIVQEGKDYRYGSDASDHQKV